MKKIISFSLWGTNTLYTIGAVKNSQDREQYYPDWICRFYVDKTVPDQIIKELDNGHNEIIYKPDSFDVLGMFWRFEAMYDDPEIERFIVRDSDSRFTDRECSLVKEWEEQGKPFHVIRDNRSHNTHILGGMWGSKAGIIDNMQIKIRTFLNRVNPVNPDPLRKYHGVDQFFLSQYVWPIIKDNHTAHILKGFEGLRYTQNDIEIPEPENGHYVGMVC